MKGLLKQDHEVLFPRFTVGINGHLLGLKQFMLSLMDYRQDCQQFHSLLHSRSLCQRSSSRLYISRNSAESFSGTWMDQFRPLSECEVFRLINSSAKTENCILVFSNLNRANLNIVLGPWGAFH